MALATTLCLMGARSVTIAGASGISDSDARELYKQIHGLPSPSGQTPHATDWYISSRVRQEESTALLLAYNAARKKLPNGEAFIRAYKVIYQLNAGNPCLDPERAYYLIKMTSDFSAFSHSKAVKSGPLAIMRCRVCGRQLLAASHHRVYTCPVCEAKAEAKAA
jgi:hypothetical protein